MGNKNIFIWTITLTVVAATTLQLAMSRSASISNFLEVEDPDYDDSVMQDIEQIFDVAESGETSIERTSRQMNPDYLPVRAGVGCGYLRMRGGQVVTIQSSNFKSGEYFNNEACVWKFFGHHCVLSAQCPCSEIPQSFGCLEDYLKITDTFLFNQRFCGDLQPQGTYESATNNLKVRFRSDSRDTAAGFLCYVSCRAPGKADYQVPKNITCPTSARPTPSTTTGGTGSTGPTGPTTSIEPTP